MAIFSALQNFFNAKVSKTILHLGVGKEKYVFVPFFFFGGGGGLLLSVTPAYVLSYYIITMCEILFLFLYLTLSNNRNRNHINLMC